METIKNAVRFCCLTLILATCFSIGYAQTLTTDASDYAPGTAVTLTGAGFGAGEDVAVLVTHNPTGGDDATSASHQPFTVTADANGGFVATWNVPSDQDELGAYLIARASGQSSSLSAWATFTDSNNPGGGNGTLSGTGSVSITSGGGDCVSFEAGNSGGPDQFFLTQGGTYTMTINGVTECSGSVITVVIQNTTGGNFCFDATGGSGSYTGTFVFPTANCATSPVSYKCGSGADCTGSGAINTVNVSGNNTVHLAAATFGAGCTNPVTVTCDPVLPPVLTCAAAGDLGCYATTDLLAAPAPVAPGITGGCTPLGAATYVDGLSVPTGGCGHSITRTWSVTDACGHMASCDQVYTYSQADAPVFDNLPTGGDLGCNPSSLPSCANGVTAHNQCGTVSATCTAGSISNGSSGNLVVNGDFEGGNTGFTSAYSYVSAPYSGGNTGLWPEGDYAVGADANTYHPYFYGTGHGGSGNFMIVNGAADPNTLVWGQTIAVIPNTNYYFSTWAVNVDGTPVASLQFSINGVQIGGIFNTQDDDFAWSQFYQVWNSGSNTSATIAILDQSTIPGGNDFGIDDIAFSTQSPGCGRSQTFHYHATSSCGGNADADVTYSWSVPTPVTINADGPVSVCEGSCVHMVADAGFASYQWYYNGQPMEGENDDNTFACATGSYSVVVTNACGCSSSSTAVTATINDAPACNVDPIAEADLPVANSNGNTLAATITGGHNNTYQWTITSSDNSWNIISGGTDPTVTFHCGTFGSSATITFVVTAHYGSLSCSGTPCTFSVSPEAHEQCAYTQGFYGQTNGVTTCIGMPAPTAVNQALHTTNAGVYDGVANPIVLGNPGSNKRITIGAAEASCVTAKLPANSSAAALGAGPGTTGWTCATYTGGSLLKNGKFNNVLIGSTLTLAINARLFPGLLNMHLTQSTFVTYASSDCNPNTAQIVPNSQLTFTIPQSVINCLGSSSTTNKVSSLLALANRALGGQALGCASGSPSPSDINAALDAINNGFDRCRIISGFNLRPDNLEVSTSGKNDFSFNYFPNPSNGVTKVMFVAPADGNANVEIYNISGSLVKTLFNENVTEGNGYNVEFDASSMPAGVYFIRTTVGESSAFGKLMIVK